MKNLLKEYEKKFIIIFCIIQKNMHRLLFISFPNEQTKSLSDSLNIFFNLFFINYLRKFLTLQHINI